MRSSRALLGVLAVVGGAYVYLATLHPPQRAPDRPYFDAPRPWVVAHRGGSALTPENTMQAFRRAEALGVDVLEMDLRVAADGAIVVIHDDTVDRTTDGHGTVAGMTLAQVQALDAGYRFQDDSGGHPFRGMGVTVPSFESVLREFPNARLNIEMKDFTPEQARGLCGMLRHFDAVQRVLVSAFDQAPMTAFRDACSEVATGATRREAIVFYYLNQVHLGRAFRGPAAAIQLPLTFRGKEVITPGLLEAARQCNRPIQVWTVDDEETMRRLLRLDVQAILTDQPFRLLAVMGRARRVTRQMLGERRSYWKYPFTSRTRCTVPPETLFTLIVPTLVPRRTIALLARFLAVDVLACTKCHGRMRLLAMVEDPANVARYLVRPSLGRVARPSLCAQAGRGCHTGWC